MQTSPSFLDIMITRNPDQTLSTEFYTKPIASNTLINYHSNHHITHKLNTAAGLIHRVYSIDQKNNDKTKNEIIHKILRINSYPKHVINATIKKYKSKRNSQNQESPNEMTSNQLNKRYASLTYIKGISERTAKFLKKENDNLQIAYSNKYKNRIFSKLKDKIPKEHKRNLVYKIPCATQNCNRVYVGVTTTSLKKRLSGHKSNISTVKQTGSAPTGLCQHIKEFGHDFDLSQTKILHECSKIRKLEMLEYLHINDNKNNVNKKLTSRELSENYKTILELINKRKKHISPHTQANQHSNTTVEDEM